MNAVLKERGATGGVVRVSTFTEPDAFERAMPWGRMSVTPLARYPFTARVIELDLDDVVLEINQIAPAVILGKMALARVGMLLPIEGIGSLSLGGRRDEPDLIAVCGAGGNYELASHSRVTWASLSLPADRLDDMVFPPAHSAIRRRDSFGVLRADPRAWRAAVQLVRQVQAVALDQPDVFEVAEARRSLRSSVLDTAHELLAGPYSAPPPRAVPLAQPQQRHLVRAAAAAVLADPAHIRGAGSLASVLDVTELRLRRAFSEVLGVGVARFVLARRLSMVRAALRAAPVPVEALARAHGFRNFGLFLKAYRARFGEALDLA